jgi:hypothetical protein
MATTELIRVAAPSMKDGALNQCVNEYASASVFQELAQPWLEDNPFRRPLLNRGFSGFDTGTPLEISQIRSNASLVANRVLMSIYERDFVFLPAKDLDS